WAVVNLRVERRGGAPFEVPTTPVACLVVGVPGIANRRAGVSRPDPERLAPVSWPHRVALEPVRVRDQDVPWDRKRRSLARQVRRWVGRHVGVTAHAPGPILGDVQVVAEHFPDRVTEFVRSGDVRTSGYALGDGRRTCVQVVTKKFG